jgi:hypothetical protein
VGFSATTLTAVFAVYVLFLLMTVLIFGSLPNYARLRTSHKRISTRADRVGAWLFGALADRSAVPVWPNR